MRLFMVQIRVSNWPDCVAWYRDILGLEVLMTDEAGRFALLEAGVVRLAIKARRAGDHVQPDDSSLIFEVPDLERERLRLIGLGVEVGPIVENRGEGFRQCDLHDPEGNKLTLFAWDRSR